MFQNNIVQNTKPLMKSEVEEEKEEERNNINLKLKN